MNSVLKNAMVVRNGHAERLDIRLRDQQIQALHPALTASDNEVVLDGSGLTVLPGFIDIHTHGALGVDFNHADAEQIRSISSFSAACGVTTYLPSVLTDDVQRMLAQVSLLGQEAVLKQNPTIGGIHLEGPFLSKAYKGAMPETLLKPVDLGLFRELYEASQHSIKVMTIAPELDGALDLIEEATSMGVKVSMGHSAASYEQTMAAIERGAVSATHTMNAMKLLHMHDPAILTAVLESDIFAEMICDGFHLHPAIIRLLLKTKGFDHMIAVTDSISSTGFPDGIYQLGVNMIEVHGGDAKVVENGVRAGSTLTMDAALRNLVSFTKLNVAELSPLVSTNASLLLGSSQCIGSIEVGKEADLVALDASNTVQLTIKQGKILYQGNAYA